MAGVVLSSAPGLTVNYWMLNITLLFLLASQILAQRNARVQELWTKPLSIHSSRLQCNITDTRRSMCMITNAYYWNQTIYFVTEDTAYFRPFIPDFTLPFAARMPQIVKGIHPAHATALFNDSTTMLQIPKGILLHRLYPTNYYHHFWEVVANVHVIACSMFNKCHYDPEEKELQVLYFDKDKQDPSRRHAKLLKCITSLDYEEMHHPTFTLPTRIEQLTMGLGSLAIGQANVVWKRALPSPWMMQALQGRMRACMQLPAVPASVSELPERIATIVQRPRGLTGRSISNVEQVQQWLGEALPGFKVVIEGMESKTMEQQVAVWNRSTVIVTNHGAQLASSIYMPNNSVIMEVDQWMWRRQLFFRQYVVQAMRPHLQIQHYFLTPTSLASVKVSRAAELEKLPTFASLAPEQRAHWLQQPECNHSFVKPQHHCHIWVKYYTDVIVERDVLEGTAAEARKWLNSHGVQVAEPEPWKQQLPGQDPASGRSRIGRGWFIFKGGLHN